MNNKPLRLVHNGMKVMPKAPGIWLGIMLLAIGLLAPGCQALIEGASNGPDDNYGMDCYGSDAGEGLRASRIAH
jgi:hypothetical protein